MPSRDAWGVGQVWGSRPSCIACCCVPDGAVPGAGQGRGPRGLSEPSLALEPGAGRRGEPSPGTLGMGFLLFPWAVGAWGPCRGTVGTLLSPAPTTVFLCPGRGPWPLCWGAMGCSGML